MLKTCSKCGESEPTAKFSKWRRQCVVCRREITREKLRRMRAKNPAYFRGYVQERQRERRATLDQLKSDPCVDCEGVFAPCCMDLDHTRGEKSINVADIAGTYSTARLLAEVAKCDLVCACCHRIRTHKRKSVAVGPRRQWLNSLKAKPCVDCGGVFPPCAMDFDHVRGVTVTGLAQMWECSRERILHEVSKCDLVCACCHRLRTQHRKKGSIMNPEDKSADAGGEDSSRVKAEWQYKEEFAINTKMREVIGLAVKASEAEIGTLRRKLDKLTYGS